MRAYNSRFGISTEGFGLVLKLVDKGRILRETEATCIDRAYRFESGLGHQNTAPGGLGLNAPDGSAEPNIPLP